MKALTESYRPIFLFLILVGAIVFSASRPFTETDMYFHAASGRNIFDKGLFENGNNWSFLKEGKTWVQTEIGYDVISYFLLKSFELKGFIFFQFLSLLLLIGVIFRRSLLNKTEVATTVLLILFLALEQERFRYRAEIFTLPFFFWLTAKTYRAPKKISGKFFVFLILFPALWQLYLASAYFAAIPIGILFLIQYQHTKEKTFLIGIPAMAAGMLLLHPYGVALHYRVIWEGYLFHQIYPIQETNSMDWAKLSFFLLAYLAADFLIWTRIKKERAIWLWGYFLIVLFFQALSLHIQRGSLYALLASIPALEDAYERWVPSSHKTLSGGLNILVTFSLLLYLNNGAFQKRFTQPEYYVPRHLARFIQTQEPPGRMFHPIPISGYFVWLFNGTPPVFWDIRLELFIQEMSKWQKALAEGEGAVKRFLEEYDISYVIYSANSRIPMLPRGEWALVYSNGHYNIQMKRTQQNLPFIHQHEI